MLWASNNKHCAGNGCRRSPDRYPFLICRNETAGEALQVASTISAKENKQFMSVFASVSHIFEDAIRKFTELRPVDEFVLKSELSVLILGNNESFAAT